MFENKEPHKCTDWRWVKWNDFVNYENLFNVFYYFFEQGFKDLDKIKEKVGIVLENGKL